MVIKEPTLQDLKNELHKQVDKLHKDQLVEVYRFVSEMIGLKLVDAMNAEDLSGKDINESIKRYRQRHPY